MSSWRECTLAEITSILGDGLHGTPNYDKNGEYFFINGNNLSNGKIIIKSDTKRADLSEYDKYKKNLNDRTILVSINGTLGNIALYNNEKCILGKSACYFNVNANVDKYFIRYVVTNKDFQEYIRNFATGTTIPNVSLKTMREYSFFLPPLEEQKAIAEVLSSLDDKIDLLHRQNQTLESLAQTLFRQWFIEEAKEEWEEKPLKEICEIINGFAFKSGDYRENGRTIIRTMNFKNGFIDNGDVVYIDIQEEIKYTKYQLQKNDFLLVMVGASLGNFAIVTNDILPALQNQNMWNFRTLGNVSQHYLNFAMRQIVEENICSASGSAREFFQKGQFYEFMIKVPDASLMNKFHHNIENFYQKIENNRKQIQTLENLRDTLLPKLLSGEVRVEI